MVRLSDFIGGRGKPGERKSPAAAPPPAAAAPAVLPQPPAAPSAPSPFYAAPATAVQSALAAYYAKLMVCVKELFVQARNKQPLQLAEASLLAQQLPKLAAGQYDEVLMLDAQWPQEHYLISHSVHVAFLANRLANTLGYTAATAHQLTLAGLLIDIGMAGEMEKLVEAPRKLTKEEKQLVSQHQANAVAMLQKSRELSREALAAIAAHHQAHGGQVKDAPASTIMEYAQILALADVYDAMTHARSWRPPINPAQAIKMLIGGVGDAFERKVVKALVDELSLYPRGSTVKLNTNEIGVVERVNPGSSLRPVIAIHRDADHNAVVPPRVISLLDHPLVYIKDIVVVDDPKELS